MSESQLRFGVDVLKPSKGTTEIPVQRGLGLPDTSGEIKLLSAPRVTPVQEKRTKEIGSPLRLESTVISNLPTFMRIPAGAEVLVWDGKKYVRAKVKEDINGQKLIGLKIGRRTPVRPLGDVTISDEHGNTRTLKGQDAIGTLARDMRKIIFERTVEKRKEKII